MNTIDSKQKRPDDAIYGAIAGDVIGSAYEFRGVGRMPIVFFKSGCSFTDDTVLTIAVADWLSTPGSNAETKLQEWGRRYPDIGYGPFFCRWLMHSSPQPYNSCGNGSAMRVSAVGCVAQSEDEAMRLARLSALPTHNHPEGIKGAQAIAVAIYLARQGATKEKIKERLRMLFDYNIDCTYTSLKREDYEFRVLCQNTVPEALVCFFCSDSYEQCISMAMSTNKDTDTAACIAGSVAAAYYGLPETIREKVVKHIPEEFVEVINALGKETKSVEPSRESKGVGAVDQDTKIKTYAILLTDNPLAGGLQEASDERSDEKMRTYLNAGNFVWFPAGGIKEGALVVIYNISPSDALHIGETFGLGGIVWCNNVTGEKQCWEQDGNGELKKSDVRNAAFDMNGEALNDMMSRHNNILIDAISRNLKRYGLDASYEERKVRQMLSDDTSGRAKWEARGNLYAGYQKQREGDISLADSHESQSHTP